MAGERDRRRYNGRPETVQTCDNIALETLVNHVDMRTGDTGRSGIVKVSSRARSSTTSCVRIDIQLVAPLDRAASSARDRP